MRFDTPSELLRENANKSITHFQAKDSFEDLVFIGDVNEFEEDEEDETPHIAYHFKKPS